MLHSILYLWINGKIMRALQLYGQDLLTSCLWFRKHSVFWSWCVEAWKWCLVTLGVFLDHFLLYWVRVSAWTQSWSVVASPANQHILRSPVSASWMFGLLSTSAELFHELWNSNSKPHICLSTGVIHWVLCVWAFRWMSFLVTFCDGHLVDFWENL